MKFLLFIPLLFCSFMLKAQENNTQFQVPQSPIPVEVMVGSEASMYQMTVDKRFAPGSRFKFFNLINYEVDHNEFTPDNYIIQSIGYYEFAKGFDAGIGGNLKAFGGFKPVVSIEYTNFSRDRGIIIQPVYETHRDGEISTMAMFEWHPVNELKELQDSAKTDFPEMQVSGEKELDTKNINLNQCELELNFQIGENSTDSLGLILENKLGEFVKIGYSAAKKQFFVDRTKSGDMSFSDKFSGIDYAPYSAGTQLKLHLFINAASAELFVDNGNLVMTDCFFPTEGFTTLSLFADKGDVSLKSGTLIQLKSIWETKY